MRLVLFKNSGSDGFPCWQERFKIEGLGKAKVIWGNLEGPSVCQFDTIGIVIVSSARISLIRSEIPISLHTGLAEVLDHPLY
jgi:hypothetical protein